ncbi:Fur family transcriptional regulator [Bradyrhizobium sp. DASA03076]|uniref:Fur family transcriptional regulator n=1 Tax=Bradyrhizobium sp. BLXBL-03 TaxID=3395916 RepID=UPI003F722D5A
MDGLSANSLAGPPAAAQAELARRLCIGRSAKAYARRLREVAVRPKRQRALLAQLLFARVDRHVTAEMLFNEAIEANIKLSIATVYNNTLNQFAKAGLLRRVMPNRSRLFFDTDTSIHPHFYLVGEGILTNIPEKLLFAQMPKALPGHRISRLDVIIYIRRTVDM